MKKIALITIGLILLGISCTTESNNNEKDIKALTSASNEAVQAWNSGNYEAFMELMDNEAILLPPNASSIVGIEAIRQVYRNYFDILTYKVQQTLDEVTVFGDYGYIVATWTGEMTPKNSGEPIAFNNKLISIYKKQDNGKWLIYRNIFNSNETLEVPQNNGQTE